MARFCPLFSSSSGNCIYIGTSNGGILIDVGVSAKRTVNALEQIGVSPEDISAIFITHEHSDHINGLKVFAGKYSMDVWASGGTLSALGEAGILNEKINIHELSSGGAEAAGMFVRPFHTSHDSAESVGYTIVTPDDKRIAVATDLGIVTPEVMNAIYGSDLVMLESNHDVDLLKRGPYPYYLKQRILSNRGHLSNECCAETALKLLDGGTTRFVLGHLSRHNNVPQLAYETTNSLFTMHGAVNGSDFLLNVANDDGKVISF
ncbi:MAG: MBL fold metallo-hydrolase [Clostridia bacterium]|nr:MBL fold metallo-hydrolase [Clostridia bacterium]